MEQDIPDYDMDSEDERWINVQAEKLVITPLQFEEMMDRLEKSSGQTVVTLNEAKSLLKQDDDFIIAVYDYWLNKRLKMLNPLIPQVKTEKFGGTGSSGNPYIAFRRRTEKMQTRKHRKNDEASYEKMLKLRRDLSRALTLLEMVKKREKCKREVVNFGIEVYDKRYQLSDYSGHIINEINAHVKQQPRPSFTPLSTIHSSNVWSNSMPPMVGTHPSLQSNRARSYKDELSKRKERRNYRKRRHKSTGRGGVTGPGASAPLSSSVSSSHARGSGAGHGREGGGHGRDGGGGREGGREVGGGGGSGGGGLTCFSDQASAGSSEDEAESVVAASHSEADEAESDIEKQGPFAFRRKLHCSYLAPAQVASPYPYCGPEDGGLADPRFRFTLTSLSSPQPRCVGFARRRIGRGGRVVLDRVYTPLDSAWASLQYGGDSNHRPSHHHQQRQDVLSEELQEEIRTSWKHFRPASPPPSPSRLDPSESTNLNHSTNQVDVDCVSIGAESDDDDKYQHFDTHDTWPKETLSSDPSEVPIHPSCGHSNFNVVGDDTGRSVNHLDWWNYFDTNFDEEEKKRSSKLGRAPCLPNNHSTSTSATSNCIMNGVNSPSTATDSPFWIVPKSASLPNNDCSIVSPCSELDGSSATQDKDQDPQQTSVVDFHLMDSTYAMEVT